VERLENIVTGPVVVGIVYSLGGKYLPRFSPADAICWSYRLSLTSLSHETPHEGDEHHHATGAQAQQIVPCEVATDASI
jgi:hypothetical protein